MTPINECVIGIDILSMCISASFSPQALMGIATVRAILVGHMEDSKPTKLPARSFVPQKEH